MRCIPCAPPGPGRMKTRKTKIKKEEGVGNREKGVGGSG
jgi:hypothetical protein